MFDVITIGDAIVDVFITLPPKGSHYAVDPEKKMLEVMLGEKIPVDSSSFSLGGNATHVGIGLSRLGFRTALAAEIGDDEFSQKILTDLEKEKVAKNFLIQTPGAPSTFTVSISVGGERTLFVRHVKRQHNFSLENLQVQWAYLTSMGEEWEEMYKKTLTFVKETGAKLAFNPGSMQLQKGAESLKDIIAASDLLIVNKEEAEELLYKEVLPQEKKEPAESLLFRLQRMGPKMVVITDAENGSYAIDTESRVFSQKAFKAEILEKTGAGDGFSAGFLGGVLSGKDIQTSLLWGTAMATGVMQKHGGQEGLLTKQELDTTIQENS